MLSMSKLPLLPFSTWPLFCYPWNQAVTLPRLWVHLCLCGEIYGWGTQPLDFLKQGLWLRFCTECVCVPSRWIHARNLMDLKSGILLEQKKEESLVAGKIVSHRAVKLYRQLNMRKTVLKLICLLCYYGLNSVFVERGWGWCLCWLTFYFAGRLKYIHERKMTLCLFVKSSTLFLASALGIIKGTKHVWWHSNQLVACWNTSSRKEYP